MKKTLAFITMMCATANSFAEETSSAEKNLIAYFSYTGNTQVMAERQRVNLYDTKI